jgi:predicted O-linked N-acetylglucosamine transferase (SPINDLY family)
VYAPPVTLPPRAAAGKIRLGYLSADLRDHVMGKMMYQAISRHDAEQFEVYCYSLSPVQDSWTERFRACSRKFVNLDKLDARRAADRIAEDSLDILVDLSTHTKGGLPAILAFKPARLQITHIASAGAVGLDTIDFKLTDHFADTPSNQDYLLERLLPMQGCVFPYRHIAPAVKHDYHRNKLGISKQAVVLGAFVTLAKLSPRCLALWARVMQALPQAVLAFSPLNNEAKAAYLQCVKNAGIEPKRVVFIPPGRDEALNQARYAVIDMVLDTLPFGGVNGTLEALDMGVPVVTLCGPRHGERTGYSILTNLGVTATIAHSEDEFVAIARRLAEDGAFRSQVTGAIRQGLEHSTLVDAAGHTRYLEEAYREAMMKKDMFNRNDKQVQP